MARPVKLRVILADDDARKLILPEGLPSSTEDLAQKITEMFQLDGDIRLQYQDDDFGGEFVNLTTITDVQDKGTLKVIFKTTGQNQTAASTPACLMLCQADDSASVSSFETDDTVLLSSPDESVQSTSRSAPWPLVFPIPCFSYDSEIILQQANAEFHENRTRLSPSPKLKSHILEVLAEEIIKYKAYPTDLDLNTVAEALINKHPCLREQGSYNGCYGWKISLKYKMANFRTKLRSVGCSEVSINSMKNKRQDQYHAASNIKKPRRAEVNYCPQHPKGETSESLERERVNLLAAIKKRNNDKVVKEKMERTFSYRRQEVVQEKPMIAEFKSRWPALFNVDEINTEFMRITTVPLEFKFLAMLDQYSDSLMKLFQSKGGVTGRTIKNIMQPISQVGQSINYFKG
uniref:PB1 domain-containing protein n=1 Tax=Cyprinus carpio TaxID=7962 RepID=A0A8C1X4F8_CYPCA